MANQPFPIADFRTGVFTAKEAWLSPQDAFRELLNARFERGKIQKRQGYTVRGYFPTRLDNDISGITLSGTDPVSIEVTAHGLTTGDYVLIQSVSGTTELNDKYWFVTRTDADNFTLTGTDSSNFSAYSSGGTVDWIKSHVRVGSISGITTDQNGRPVIQITSHGLTTGDQVQILDSNVASVGAIVGMTEITNTIDTVEVLTANTFALQNVDASNFTAYTSGGVVATLKTDRNNAIIGIGEYENDATSNIQIVSNQRRIAKYNPSNDLYESLNLSPVADLWTANLSDYIWFANWRNKLYLVARDSQSASKDGIFTYDGSTTIDVFNPTIKAGDTLLGAKFIIPFNGRLVAFHTTEGSTTYPWRIRWSKRNDPDSWDETNPNEGGSLDAATEQEIISIQQIRDIVVVIFENSIWAVTKTGSADIPFRWEKIVDEIAFFSADFGSESHQQLAVAVGKGGMYGTDGINVTPFDEDIPDFELGLNDNTFEQIFIYKDIAKQEIWILYCDDESTFNNKVKIFNFEDRVWYDYDIEMNVLGKTETSKGGSWQNLIDQGYIKWEQLFPDIWKSFINVSLIPETVGGNRRGIIFDMNSGGSDAGTKIKSTIRSQRFSPLKTDGMSTMLSYMDVLFSQFVDGEFTFKFFTDWSLGEDVTRVVESNHEINTSVSKVWERIYVNNIGNIHEFEITHEDQFASFEIHAFVPYMRQAGRFNL